MAPSFALLSFGAITFTWGRAQSRWTVKLTDGLLQGEREGERATDGFRPHYPQLAQSLAVARPTGRNRGRAAERRGAPGALSGPTAEASDDARGILSPLHIKLRLFGDSVKFVQMYGRI